MRALDEELLHAEVASVLDWWAMAGVDLTVDETSRNWLRPPARSAAPMEEVTPSAGAEPLPDTLDAFINWLATGGDPTLLGSPAERLAPIGDRAATLMVLIDMPGVDDVAAAALLAGEVGAMFDRMLAIEGLEARRESIWLASLFPARPPRGRADPQRLSSLADIARHHIALKKPRKLLLMGQEVAAALLGPGQHRGRFHQLETPAGTVPTVASYSPHVLQATPAMKRAAWDDLKLLAKGDEA